MSTPSDVHQQIIGHLKTIPMFEHLTDGELQKIYGICTFKRVATGEKMYDFGTPSNDLFILLDGRLVARTKTGVDLAYISPIGRRCRP